MRVTPWAVLTVLLLSIQGLSVQAGAEESDRVLVSFLTTRAVQVAEDGQVRYSTDVADLSAGRCELALQDDGEFEVLDDGVTALPLDELINGVPVDSRRLLIYLHGYNIGLHRACRDAAQLARRTGFSGDLLLFSWPASQLGVTYRRDEERLADSLRSILDAIVALSRRYGHDNVSLVAHSMGSRVVLALAEGAGDASLEADPLLQNLVLVAPDIDRQRFLDVLPRLRAATEHLYLVVSDGDKLLRLSELVNQGERLGRSRDLVIEGVQVLDVSDLDDLGPTGHIYHLENDVVGGLIGDVVAPATSPRNAQSGD